MAGYAGLITKFSKQEIDQLFKNSKRIARNEHATVLASPRSKNFARILIILPKTVGNAVARNLLKRRLKNIFYQEKMYRTLNYDIVLIGRKPLTTLSFQKLKEFLKKIDGKLS